MGKNKDKNSDEKAMEILSLSEAAKLSGYTPEHLNLMARKGKLAAEKLGRNWQTTPEWLREFLAGVPSEERREPAKNFLREQIELDKLKADREKENIKQNFKAREVLEEIEREEFKEKQNETFNQKIFDLHLERHKNSWLKIFAAVSSAVIILPLFFFGTYIVRSYVQNSGTDSELAKFYSENQNLFSQIINENTESGKVAGEETGTGNGIILASENYRVKDINLGGNIIVAASGENQALEINDIKSESFVANKKDEVNLVISWQTNKMANSELSYSKNNGQDTQSAKENSYGFTHSVVVPGLDPGTSYVYQIKCRDRWGSEKISDYFGIYTSSKPVSVFDLISNALGDVFGWAIKK